MKNFNRLLSLCLLATSLITNPLVANASISAREMEQMRQEELNYAKSQKPKPIKPIAPARVQLAVPKAEPLKTQDNMAKDYKEMRKFLTEEMASYYKNNLTRQIKGSNIGPHGAVLDLTNREEAKSFLVFSLMDPEETHKLFRQVYNLDQAATELPEYKQEIYQLQLAQAMNRYHFDKVPPAEAIVHELFLNWGLPYDKVRKTPASNNEVQVSSPKALVNQTPVSESIAKSTTGPQINYDEAAEFVDQQIDLLSNDSAFEALVDRLKESAITKLDSRKWLYTVLPYSTVEDTGLNESEYQKLIDKLVIKADRQVASNKANQNWLDIPGQAANGVVNNLTTSLTGLVSFAWSGLKFATFQADENDKKAVYQGGTIIGTTTAGCAAGGFAAGAAGSVVPFFGTAAGGVTGCLIGGFTAKTATSYAFEASNKGGVYNPFEPGNQNVLCGRSEASFAHCAAYLATELGMDAVTLPQAKGLLNSVNDLKSKKGLGVNACADSYNSSLTLFNPDGIGNLSESNNSLSPYSPSINASAGSRCNKYNFPQEGVNVKLADSATDVGAVKVKLILKNGDSLKVALKEAIEEKSGGDFSEAIKSSKKNLPPGSRQLDFTYGRFQFDHVIPTHQLMNNLMKLGIDEASAMSMIGEAVAKIGKKAGLNGSELDVNSPPFVRFISEQDNAGIKNLIDQEFKQFDPKVKITSDDLIDILSKSNRQLHNSMTPSVEASEFRAPNSIINTLIK